MATEVKLPELGENLSEGEVLDIRVKLGDDVTEGQMLLEVEAEKSTVEVPSPVAGKIREVLVKKGDTIAVGQTLCTIDETANGRSGPGREGEAPAEPVVAARQEPRPSKTRGSDDGKTDKPSRTAPSPTVAAKSAAAESTASAPAKLVPPEVARAAEPAGDAGSVRAGPATRQLARELGVDLAQVHGTGPGSRVTPDDVKAFVRQVVASSATSGPGISAPKLPDFSRWGEIETRPLDGVRRKTAEQMSLAWRLIPHVTQHDLADITELEAFRKEREGNGPKLTITAFALKAAAIALREFPQFNSSLDQAAGQLILKRYYHIGVAVDTERGLLVPVLRDVNTKNVATLAQELADVAEKARQKKITLDELRGGTFTITNLGGIGGTGFSPIINYPEVAILGLSRGRLQPVIHGGAVVPRLLLPLSLSYDHRVIDGAAAARFARRVAEMLERPLLMVVDG